ncbi:MAG: LysM peptidoglycan-binding domain-containing protein [Clostridia bacterium]|nr:LysM peptidoglycan-binding domain-containing protein [Clostridia bacterium]MBQ5770741.1 LysM peptidoglycan-binding domain-containing protein [Clostridia bacterium]
MEQANAVVRCPQGTLRYVWKAGDTLVSVATAFQTTVGAMIQANPDIDFSTIRPDTQVCIPTRTLTCPGADLYVIKKGDTLWDLAREYNVSVNTLMELNPYVEPTRLAIGQYICVPKRPAGGQTPPSDNSCQIVNDVPDCASLRAAERACTGTDTVQCGQTLYDILNKYGISFQEFAEFNPRLVLNALLPGQRYIYPLKACACSGNGRYIVQPGDTISSIAAAFGITPSELLRRNPAMRPGDFVRGAEICVSYQFS